MCFAAPRCSDLTELIQVQLLFATKYGKEFVSAATELMPDCGVNRQVPCAFVVWCDLIGRLTNIQFFIFNEVLSMVYTAANRTAINSCSFT